MWLWIHICLFVVTFIRSWFFVMLFHMVLFSIGLFVVVVCLCERSVVVSV